MKYVFEIPFNNTELGPTFSVCCCRPERFINHPLLPGRKEHLLTPRHVGIFLILFQWMEKKYFQKYPTREKGGEGMLNENSLCVIGTLWSTTNYRHTQLML